MRLLQNNIKLAAAASSKLLKIGLRMTEVQEACRTEDRAVPVFQRLSSGRACLPKRKEHWHIRWSCVYAQMLHFRQAMLARNSAVV